MDFWLHINSSMFFLITMVFLVSTFDDDIDLGIDYRVSVVVLVVFLTLFFLTTDNILPYDIFYSPIFTILLIVYLLILLLLNIYLKKKGN